MIIVELLYFSFCNNIELIEKVIPSSTFVKTPATVYEPWLYTFGTISDRWKYFKIILNMFKN